MKRINILLGVAILMVGTVGGYAYADFHNSQPVVITQELPPEVVYERVEVEVPKVITVEKIKAVPRIIETELTDEEKEMIAGTVWIEGGNQDMIGKRLIVDTILNRRDDPDFPNTIEGVLKQEHQYARSSKYTKACLDAVEMEIYERLDYDIYWFSSDGYLPYGTPAYIHGDHYFSRIEL